MCTTAAQGNLQPGSELAEKMPGLMRLKSAIYSPEYRAFMERSTGVEPGTLTDEVGDLVLVLCRCLALRAVFSNLTIRSFR